MNGPARGPATLRDQGGGRAGSAASTGGRAGPQRPGSVNCAHLPHIWFQYRTSARRFHKPEPMATGNGRVRRPNWTAAVRAAHFAPAPLAAWWPLCLPPRPSALGRQMLSRASGCSEPPLAREALHSWRRRASARETKAPFACG